MSTYLNNEIVNVGIYDGGSYEEVESASQCGAIHSFDNDVACYSASMIRDHFDTAEATARCFGRESDMKLCVLLKEFGWIDLPNDNMIQGD